MAGSSKPIFWVHAKAKNRKDPKKTCQFKLKRNLLQACVFSDVGTRLFEGELRPEFNIRYNAR